MSDSSKYMEFVRWNSPVVRYWWYRKQSEVINLLNRNKNKLSQIKLQDKTRPLFVDIGCGTGSDLLLYQTWFEKNCPQWNLLGIDLDSENFPKDCNAKNIQFIVSDITSKLPFEDNSVAILYCSEVIEHIPEPEALIGEIKRVLNPAGYLIITTPNAPNLFERSYWSSKHREKMKKIKEKDFNKPHKQFKVNDKIVDAWGHISVRTIKKWEETLTKLGFKTIDYARGSSMYGDKKFFDNSWILAAFFSLEALLSIFPRQMTRTISSQLIGMYGLKD